MPDIIHTCFDTLRIAIAPNASRQARAAGAAACRTLLAALATTGSRADSPGVVAALREIPSDRLLEMAIAKIPPALAAHTDATTSSSEWFGKRKPSARPAK